MPRELKPIVFYGYPSNPPDIGETIEKFAKAIRTGDVAEVRTWRDLDIVGLRVIKQVTKKIDQCDVFACDLTYLNNNVLFELGYAISKGKRIFISLNTDIKDAQKRFSSLPPLVSIGFQAYRNSRELHDNFYSSRIYEKGRLSLADHLSLFDTDDKFGIFYLKSAAQSDAAFRVTEIIQSYAGQNITDDPSEIPADTLIWYSKNIKSCQAFFAHFMFSEQVGQEEYNNKTSFIAGLAHGSGKDIYLLAQAPFSTPSDMPDFVKLHSTADQAEGIVKAFVSDIRKKQEKLVRDRQNHALNRQKAKSLSGLRLGEHLAENESESLYDYFVETGSFNEIIRGQQTVFIGRKGTGKTANLLMAQKVLGENKLNLVVVIKPVGYEVEGLVGILNDAIEPSVGGFFVDDLWKYLVYTEIAKNIFNRYDENPSYSRDQRIIDLMEFCGSYKDVVLNSFSERLGSIIKNIDLRNISPSENKREYIAKKLHSGVLDLLNKRLIPVLERYKTIIVLIDNLDKGWSTGIDVQKVSEVLFGLLSATKTIPDNIKRTTRSDNSMDFKITVFLRSDIYIHVLRAARERDKLDVQRIEWKDREILSRILDQRIMINQNEKIPEEVWKEYFTSNVEDQHPRDFIVDNIRPRPRDAIYFMKQAINEAVSRGHSLIEAQDLISARDVYSEWAYNSLLDEDDPDKMFLKDILFKFIGEKPQYNESEILEIISSVVSGMDESTRYLNLLCDSQFLEIETRGGDFKVVDNPEERDILLTAMRRQKAKVGAEPVFQINKPFKNWLQIGD